MDEKISVSRRWIDCAKVLRLGIVVKITSEKNASNVA